MEPPRYHHLNLCLLYTSGIIKIDGVTGEEVGHHCGQFNLASLPLAHNLGILIFLGGVGTTSQENKKRNQVDESHDRLQFKISRVGIIVGDKTQLIATACGEKELDLSLIHI